MAIQQNTTLFSLIGVQYGGDGRTTFGLPDLRGRAIVQIGQGPGLSLYVQGQASGIENVTLLQSEMPLHTHPTVGTVLVTVSDTPGNLSSPASNFLGDSGANNQYGEESDGTSMAPGLVAGTSNIVGGNTPHSNMMPYNVMNYIIALQGIYPTRP